MPKYCSKCGMENDDNSKFCRGCGETLSGGSNLSNNNTNNNNNFNNKLLIGIIILLVAIVAIVGTYAVLSLNNDGDNNTNSDTNVNINDSGASVSNVENVENTASWHKIGSYSGVGDKTISLNSNNNNRLKVVSSAMPIKNYADNFMYTSISRSGYSVGSSQLSWNSKSAVATKSDTLEFSGTGTYSIYVSTYELQYWNLEIYEYY